MRLELPQTFKYLDTIAKKAVKEGFVLLTDRTKNRRWFPDAIDAIKTKSELTFGKKNAVGREAKNAPIQATNAYIIKEAIVRIYKEYIEPNKIDANLLMSVHDELVYRFPEDLTEFPDKIAWYLTDTSKSYLKNGLEIGSASHIDNTWYK